MAGGRGRCKLEVGGRSEKTSFCNFTLIRSTHLHLCEGKISASEKVLPILGNEVLTDLSFVNLASTGCWAQCWILTENLEVTDGVHFPGALG